MRVFIAVLLLALLFGAPGTALAFEPPPVCDFAYERGKFIEWFTCLIFSQFFSDYQSDWFGNGGVT